MPRPRETRGRVCARCRVGQHRQCDSGTWTEDTGPTFCSCWADNHGRPEPDYELRREWADPGRDDRYQDWADGTAYGDRLPW